MSTHLPISVGVGLQSVGLEQELIYGVDDGIAVFLHGGSNCKGIDDNGVNRNRACVVPGEFSGALRFLERQRDLVGRISFRSKANDCLFGRCDFLTDDDDVSVSS
jgi:hypothetical protein